MNKVNLLRNLKSELYYLRANEADYTRKLEYTKQQIEDMEKKINKLIKDLKIEEESLKQRK